jgi:hypothetical protein
VRGIASRDGDNPPRRKQPGRYAEADRPCSAKDDRAWHTQSW